MLSLPFLTRFSAIVPLTEDRLHQILKKARCTPRCRFGLLLAVEATGQEYFVCRQAQLATMTVQQFSEALALALSFRLREPCHTKPFAWRRGGK